jgi:hypothetical protein
MVAVLSGRVLLGISMVPVLLIPSVELMSHGTWIGTFEGQTPFQILMVQAP